MDSRARVSCALLLALAAGCRSGNGSGSDGGSIPTPGSAPQAPASFVQIYPVDGGAGVALETNFRWEESPGATEYRLEISTDPLFPAFASVVAELLPALVTETTLPSGMLLPLQTYYWRVVALHAAGETIATNGPFVMQTADPTTPLGIKLNYDNGKSETDPGFLETYGHFFYPAGKGPITLGYAPEKLVVVLSLRGGNENLLELETPLIPSPFLALSILPRGWFAAEPNYPVFDTALGEKYTRASAGVALLVQFLRANAEPMNLDPEKIFSHGRSFGGIHSFAIGFKEEFQDPNSPDPVAQQSSRPNFIIPKNSASALDCMDLSLAQELATTFLPEGFLPASFAQDAAEESAYWWLLHPQDYERTWTPPMCLVYEAQIPGSCGTITNPHHGIFGLIMKTALSQYAANAEPELSASSQLLDSTLLSEEEIHEQIAEWIEARLADP